MKNIGEREPGLCSQAKANREQLTKVLSDEFGCKDFRPLQLEIISATLENKRDIVVHMPVGAGKSLLYQLPAKVKEGITLVIQPLRALLSEQEQLAKLYKIPSIRMYASTDDQSVASNIELDLVVNGKDCRLIFLTVELLAKNLKVQQQIKQLHNQGRLRRLVVDECHCIGDAKADFRSDYLHLFKLTQDLLPGLRVTCMSAVGSSKTMNKVSHSVQLQAPLCFRGEFYTTNRKYSVQKKKSRKDFDGIVKLLKNSEGSAIVYCLTKSDCENLHKHLMKENISSEFFTGGLNEKERDRRKNLWETDYSRVMCATDAFGLGINRPDVRWVIHLSPPLSMSMYYQHCGRAGRDGDSSECILFYHLTDSGMVSIYIGCYMYVCMSLLLGPVCFKK